MTTTADQQLRQRNTAQSTKQNDCGSSSNTHKHAKVTQSAAMATNDHERSTTGSRFFVFALCLVFRLINAYFTRTYDNPDEYWQSQEVAHHMVFGYGYLTWEWIAQIRSYAHPLMFALIYKLLAWMQLDQTNLLILVPKLFQACMAALTDYATYSLAKRVVGNNIAPYILFITLSSWYNFFMAARTLSNAVETTFTVVALNYWPLPSTITDEYKSNSSSWARNYRISLVWASLACVMRPTNALIWLFAGLWLVFKSPGRHRITVLVNAATIVTIILAADVALDTYIYAGGQSITIPQAVVWTPINFLRINVLQSISLIYGVHPWHWYISQGVPVILTTLLPLAFYGYHHCSVDGGSGSEKDDNDIRFLGQLITWVLSVYSLLSHKEFRFIFPIVPLMLIFVAVGLSHVPLRWRKWIALALVATQIPMALYLCLWHQRGVTDVMLWIREQQYAAPKNTSMSVGVLMPCHSTPWQSIVHRPDVAMWFLTCEPPFNESDDGYVDEADRFYADPVLFLNQEIGQRERQWPTHLVFFENLLEMDDGKNAKQVLVDSGYYECARFFNSHFHDDWRRRGDVLVYCRT
ncbi:Alg9-like mannosyltransferase family-domain-containing protein [Zychaea mexicana]|uniref:Alg9-like mannosyltransferase family-domain-containing protein n=1 Tax=Zychaea mexicana TaxID=64656 RepID=UPI0022FEC6ED|nr:Alg9-like mannosyltransferase family-domain-containing protein [Zychaea mexicana]KAI9495468.1 Alg9-like mannosyltransferase family-domain-containing protein [Zychaea mexicana]